jgi:D-2-hydroxyacid dehydrogenase (NADP+)
MNRTTHHVGRRFISMVTCVDRSVFPTAPFAEMERVSTIVKLQHQQQQVKKALNPIDISIHPLPFSAATSSITVPKDPTLLEHCDHIVIGTRDAPLLEQILKVETTPHLKWIHCLAAGVDQLPFEQLRSRAALDPDFLVTHHTNISSVPLAEYAIAGYLHFAKRIPAMTSNFQHQVYERPPKNQPPQQITNKTVGIIGFGSIGRAVSRICRHGFKMKVWAMTRKERDKNDPIMQEANVVQQYSAENLHNLLQHCDLVVLALPNTRRTDHMIGEKELGWMKNDAVLCNLGRGNSIDEEALAKVLSSPLHTTLHLGSTGMQNKNICCVLDVYAREPLPPDSPLWKVPEDRLLMSPHSADQTEVYWRDTANVWLRNAEAYVRAGGGKQGVAALREDGISHVHVVDLMEEY